MSGWEKKISSSCGLSPANANSLYRLSFDERLRHGDETEGLTRGQVRLLDPPALIGSSRSSAS